MNAVEIRETFLSFFESQAHKRYPSASLIPQDPTLLLTNAGMVPFKPYFLGDAEPESPRATSFQKCARTVDIENVGVTTRHLTLFEMLGNFSLGDYFKTEAIRWAWELSVERYKLDADRIWVTVYEEDQETADIWTAETDVPSDRIQVLGRTDNYWWMHVAGPGGPNTELYYDRGDGFGEAGGPAANDERYLEFYNLVFMQHLVDQAGSIVGDLPKQNVDTGLGLERMAVLLQDVPTVFETDVFAPIMQRAQEVTGRTYGESADDDIKLRIIAEHARTATFLIGDGVLPSKEGRGYVLRRLVRRAVRNARQLDVEGPVMAPMIDAVVSLMGGGTFPSEKTFPGPDTFPSNPTALYPELAERRELIERVAIAEETEFGRTLDQGLALLDEAIAHAKGEATGKARGAAIPGATAFKLHDTFGFPIDLTVEIVAEAGFSLNRDEFDRLMQEQRERGRAALKRDAAGLPPEVYRQVTSTNEFAGYDQVEIESSITALLTPAGAIESAQEGDELEVVLAATSFYAEGGGQVGDQGVIDTPTGRFDVLDTQSPSEGLITHRARVAAGEVATGQTATARVDAGRRAATARSHSATHVLHATMRHLLGGHAQQAGSLVEPGRLRFDFAHFEQISRTSLAQIEHLVNERVLSDPDVTTQIMGLDEAKDAGATANFGDKYGQIVRVVSIGDFSMELCGGTHVGSGARIGAVTIVREESIGANTRRIEALTGLDAHRYGATQRALTEELVRLLDVPPDEVVDRVTSLVDRVKAAERQVAAARKAGLGDKAAELAGTAQQHGALTIVTAQLDGLTVNDLRQVALDIRGRLSAPSAVVLGSATDEGKAQLVATISKDLAENGTEAQTLLDEAAKAVGGGAGGKGDFAQAGGKDSSGISNALELAVGRVRELAKELA